MMGIEVPETCLAYHKCMKHLVTSSWFSSLRICNDARTNTQVYHVLLHNEVLVCETLQVWKIALQQRYYKHNF